VVAAVSALARLPVGSSLSIHPISRPIRFVIPTLFMSALNHASTRHCPTKWFGAATFSFCRGLCTVLLTVMAAGMAACAEVPSAPNNNATAPESSQRLQEGDDIRIAFPGAPNFDSVQKIRSDGKITLPIIGDVHAAGTTTVELQKTLTELYTKELINPEVTVSVVASTFPVYVTGAVLQPGEVRCDRPITVFEVIMKAGGFDPIRANLEKVSIIPRNGKKRDVNLRLVMEGKAPNSDFVSPFDVIVVPDKKVWL
jgi:polysaccharide biosynthesis/export protein